MSDFEQFDELCEIEAQQRLMLEALVLEAPQDQERFSLWLVNADLDALDTFTLRLVPALYRKFQGAYPGDPRLEQMKGVYRYFHLRNSLIVADGRRAVAALLDAGIDVLLFKGIAVALKYYKDIAIRPMGDVDVLVRPESVSKAEQILHGQGWKDIYSSGQKIANCYSHNFINAQRGAFDLHQYSLSESQAPGIDDGLWMRAETFDWRGLRVKLMSPEDLVLASLVNGVREIQPIRANWVHDLACIASAEPPISWPTLWGEARKRGLRDRVFDALCLVRGISSDLVSDALLHALVDNDPEFRRELLERVVAEGRTHGLSRAWKDQSGGASADAPGSPRHVRFFLNEKLRINRIYLHRRHLPFLADLFDVRDRTGLEAIVARQLGALEGCASIPSGRLALKANPELATYSARMVVGDGLQELVMTPGETRKLSLEVENDSTCCWAVCAGSSMLFGVYYRLLAEDGRLLVRDSPRTHLAIARRGYVAFIEPSQKLACELSVVAPSEPGRYLLQLDLVHEFVAYFSERGCQFPRIHLEVRARVPAGGLSVNGSDIVHETIGRETFIVDTRRQAYYTAEGYGSLIWNAIVDGHDASRIAAAFATAHVFDAGEEGVELFIASLLDEGLIVACDAHAAQPRGTLFVEVLPDSEVPMLNKHADPRDLLEMHPLSGSSARDGWPYPPDAHPPEEVPGS